MQIQKPNILLIYIGTVHFKNIYLNCNMYCVFAAFVRKIFQTTLDRGENTHQNKTDSLLLWVDLRGPGVFGSIHGRRFTSIAHNIRRRRWTAIRLLLLRNVHHNRQSKGATLSHAF